MIERPFEITTDGLKNMPFTLTDKEVEALYSYFILRAGYISYEHDAFIIVLITNCKQSRLEKSLYINI